MENGPRKTSEGNAGNKLDRDEAKLLLSHCVCCRDDYSHSREAEGTGNGPVENPEVDNSRNPPSNNMIR